METRERRPVKQVEKSPVRKVERSQVDCSSTNTIQRVVAVSQVDKPSVTASSRSVAPVQLATPAMNRVPMCQQEENALKSFYARTTEQDPRPDKATSSGNVIDDTEKSRKKVASCIDGTSSANSSCLGNYHSHTIRRKRKGRKGRKNP